MDRPGHRPCRTGDMDGPALRAEAAAVLRSRGARFGFVHGSRAVGGRARVARLLRSVAARL
ncbi:hypothetical protein Ae406Ps2_3660 [Pseudonocardia sp. Ae406_Ps2]|nr:hypothetical protein Ae331Ps2_2279c [Pseudonocardia sp. Ae331_Ps2]OLM03660.1 hypothetical protein Ae406Ps2_3660 [Pseudonocardia sp. Ae406_Ps2]OLM11482.1 hypothetical protein Ae505Ps2_1606c [Pseudonocardia sp. Ae505_Ps2]OLM25219.1 hypothetical protein Ae706Ps2_3652 [Pseudonocardia sp. Ae706_Ps2]